MVKKKFHFITISYKNCSTVRINCKANSIKGKQLQKIYMKGENEMTFQQSVIQVLKLDMSHLSP